MREDELFGLGGGLGSGGSSGRGRCGANLFRIGILLHQRRSGGGSRVVGSVVLVHVHSLRSVGHFLLGSLGLTLGIDGLRGSSGVGSVGGGVVLVRELDVLIVVVVVCWKALQKLVRPPKSRSSRARKRCLDSSWAARAAAMRWRSFSMA